MKRLIVVSILGFLLSPVLVAKDAARPNILFALADDWSYPHAGAYGCTWVKTPTFDRIARQGLLFTQVYTPTAKCAPSRCAILTGRNPWQLGPAVNHISYFPADIKSYPEALEETLAAQLAQGVQTLKAMGYTVQGEVLKGEVIRELSSFAERVGADLIVVGHKHEPNLLRRWWSGSTAKSLVEESPCNVLSVVDRSLAEAP